MQAPVQVSSFHFFFKTQSRTQRHKGAWILDLAREVPGTTELIGIDVSKAQFPQNTLPPNVRFQVVSITDLPQEWTGHIDFVHQRLLIGGLLANDWPIALENYMRVLRPGGHIQLAEVIPRTSTLTGPAGKLVAKIFDHAYDDLGLMVDCADKLPVLLRKAGFVNIRAELKLAPCGDVLGPDGEEGKVAIAGSIRAMREAFVRTGLVHNTEDLYNLAEKVEQEWNAMGGFYMTYCVAVAEKPHSTA